MKNLFILLSLVFIYSSSVEQEVTEYTETSELNLDPNEYNIIFGEIILMGNNVVLEAGDQVEMVATQSITLEPGFQAKDGSHFIARIDSSAAGISSAENPIRHIDIFPNPSKDFISVQFNNPQYIDNYSLYITDLNGKVLYKNTALKEHIQIDISSFSEGVYFLKTIDKQTKSASVHKIIKGK